MTDSSRANSSSVPVLLVRLLDVAPEARASWLQQNAAPELHEQLLRLAREADDEGTLAQSSAGSKENQAEERIGLVVGNYRLVELIGQGGMGAVYRGERQGDYHHEAAIKLAKPEVASQLVLERMTRERQILADLDHPNIARLLDGGSTESGELFLVLEYVNGKAITEHCRDRNLSTREIVRLFLRVCEAVAAAHRSLLVHGDLKPSNILVREDGTAKLLDFGVARALSDPDATSEVLGWTPGFASPEQLAGKSVGVSSDVYSLGVLLYLLLTSELPHRLPSQPVDAKTYLETMTLQSVQAPSDVVRQQRSTGLSVELDAILLKCLRVQPQERYGTVVELMADLENFLAHRPVSALPANRLYAARKFAARHRLGVAATLLAMLGLVTSWAIALERARVARQEAIQSDLERQRAERTRLFLLDIFDVANIEQTLSVGPEVKVVEALDIAARRLWADESLAAEDQASFAITLADLHQNLQQFDAARNLVERARELLRAEPEIPAITQARVLRSVAHMNSLDGDDAAAVEVFGQAVELLVENHGLFGGDFEALDLQLAMRAEVVAALWRLDRCQEALRIVQPVLELRHRLREFSSEERPKLADNLSGAISNTASCAWSRGDFEGAYGLSKEALAILEESSVAEVEQTAVTKNNVGFYAVAVEDWQGAREHFSSAIEISERLGVAELRNGIRHIMLARAEGHLGEYASAQRNLERGLRLSRTTYEGRPRLWTALARAGEAAVAIGDQERAVALYWEAVIGEEQQRPDSSQLDENRARLALLLLEVQPEEERIDDLIARALENGGLQGNERVLGLRKRLEAVRDSRQRL